jgi:hypothetical protein
MSARTLQLYRGDSTAPPIKLPPEPARDVTYETVVRASCACGKPGVDGLVIVQLERAGDANGHSTCLVVDGYKRSVRMDGGLLQLDSPDAVRALASCLLALLSDTTAIELLNTIEPHDTPDTPEES